MNGAAENESFVAFHMQPSEISPDQEGSWMTWMHLEIVGSEWSQ